MIDSKKISERMGVKVSYNHLDDKTLAIATIKHDQFAFICVNDEIDFSLQNFVIAHQLGHFLHNHFKILGKRELKDYNNTVSSFCHIDEFERTATRFALKLTAPLFVLNGLIRKGISNPEDLSRILGIEKSLLKSYLLSKFL